MPGKFDVPYTLEAVKKLFIEVDASAYGGGYVLKNASNDALWLRAYAWNQKQFNYHVNRLEGLSLLKALREFSNFLEFLQEVSFGVPQKLDLQIVSDNKCAIAWASGQPPSNSKGLEYRMLSRLQEALVAEMELLRVYTESTAILHCSGESNRIADKLSRLLYHKNIGSMIRGEEVINEMREEGTHLIEAVAQLSFDFDTLQSTVLRYCRFFDPASDSRCILRAVQTLMTAQQKQKYVQKEGIYYHEWYDAKGILNSRGVIPRQAIRTRFLLAKKLHRASGHKGKRYDMAAMMGPTSPFFVEGFGKVY